MAERPAEPAWPGLAAEKLQNQLLGLQPAWRQASRNQQPQVVPPQAPRMRQPEQTPQPDQPAWPQATRKEKPPRRQPEPQTPDQLA